MALVFLQRSPSCSNSISSSDSGGGREDENQRTPKSLNECYFAGKGTALMLGSNERLQRGDGRRFSQISNELSASQTSIGSSGSDIQQHLQSMFYLLRPEETLKMAVKLESLRAGRTRYLVVVSRPINRQAQQTLSQQDASTVGGDPIPPAGNSLHSNSISLNPTSYFNETATSSRLSANLTATCDNDAASPDDTNQCQSASDETESNLGSNCSRSSSNETEESCLLGIDCNEKTTVGLVLRVLADTAIRLDGDGGFSVSVCGRQHIFKPVSVQAMWSALQTLYKISSKAQEHNFFAGGPSHDWVQYYESRIESDRSCLNEWHAMDSLESRRPPSPDTVRNKPTERDETERVIRTALKEIMMSVDLDEVTSKYIRGRLEEHLDMDLGEFKSFIDEEMLVILGQMDAPTEIFEHVYLGSEWNASNLEELQRNGVRHILNVTREIDNFFPGMFDYCNVRVYDDEKTDLLKHWDNTFKYISRAKMEGSKVLVHCKMGISRSASVVIAYAMKAYNWDFDQAIRHVKEKRNCIKPNKSFVLQLETYQGILDAMKNKEKLQRSKSETNLKSDNAKDGKMLPGSEPTPLIQALQHNKNSTYPSSKKDARRISHRPTSSTSSPDISKSTSENVSLAKPISLSLETLVTEVPHSETTNLRWPCNHGHYSISQNQIIYLENETNPSPEPSNLPLVRSIITELEQHQEKMREKEAWDPGEDKPQVYTCSAEIIRQDSFGVKRLPDHVSRQSSWSSVDSACVIGDLPSRNSSWGSGDNHRAVPSRNSSWGSYDTKIQQSVLTEEQMGQSGIFQYEKDEIPWHPGTVKRTKQRIEEKQEAKTAKTQCDSKKDSTSPKLVKLRQSDMRCKSEEHLKNEVPGGLQLSASAPETSALETVKLRQKTAKPVGKVKNLKMNFEAKANNSPSQSVPSSPIAIHIDVAETNSEDIKTLISQFDGVAKMRSILSPNNSRQRPKSLYETSRYKTLQPKPLSILQKCDEFKRPPIPSQCPTVKNALMTSNTQNVIKTLGRKVQQHGKTHPLAKLGAKVQQRLNTSPAATYNTM